MAAASGTWTGPFGCAGNWGYQEDGDSGLQLLGHRYYDPSTGRFLTRDPIKDGRNWYTYCENNPLTAVDPLGLWGIGFTLGGQLIIGVVSILINMTIMVNDEGMTAGAGVGYGLAVGLYAGVSGGLTGDHDYSYYDDDFARQKGYATGVATPAVTVEILDDNGIIFDGGYDGESILIGPGAGGGIYRELREGGFLQLFEW
ncbi:MAG: RHS repeat-associated core domain-containing protein [Fimbriimonadaceae bacterium]|nr:RHS repeat-associated core domain-containing protein [Fimbriimonadaceae bacterium]